MQYRVAREVERIAQPIIAEHHRHLVNTRIVFLFSDNTSMSGGQEVWAKTRKISGLAAFLAFENEMPTSWIEKEEDFEDSPEYPPSFFVLTVSSPIWHNLEAAQQRALVDHELCHMEVSEDTGKLSVRAHFIEEFPEILKRHGLWSHEVEVFHEASEEAAQQLSFDDAGDDDDPGIIEESGEVEDSRASAEGERALATVGSQQDSE